MECIPETQFLMRSKINLGLLLHIWHVCKREKDYSQFEQILLQACFIEDPGSNPRGGKKNFDRAGIFQKQQCWGANQQSKELQADTLPLRHAFLMKISYQTVDIFFFFSGNLLTIFTYDLYGPVRKVLDLGR